jgi:Uma2 family endonuclease
MAAPWQSPKDKPRDYFLVWEEEGHAPGLVIEFTCESTRDEDVKQKLALYRDVLKVPEFFLFDPHRLSLTPSAEIAFRSTSLILMLPLSALGKLR